VKACFCFCGGFCEGGDGAALVALALVVEWAWLWLLMTSDVVAPMRAVDVSAQGSFDSVVLA
jgi:hypothetical protein